MPDCLTGSRRSALRVLEGSAVSSWVGGKRGSADGALFKIVFRCGYALPRIHTTGAFMIGAEW